jgi:hypothetical protein
MRRTYVVEGAIENLEDDDNLVTASSNDLGRWLILYSLTNDFPRIMISMIEDVPVFESPPLRGHP